MMLRERVRPRESGWAPLVPAARTPRVRVQDEEERAERRDDHGQTEGGQRQERVAILGDGRLHVDRHRRCWKVDAKVDFLFLYLDACSSH